LNKNLKLQIDLQFNGVYTAQNIPLDHPTAHRIVCAFHHYHSGLQMGASIYHATHAHPMRGTKNGGQRGGAETQMGMP
jgi:hypothetical protein